MVLGETFSSSDLLVSNCRLQPQRAKSENCTEMTLNLPADEYQGLHDNPGAERGRGEGKLESALGHKETAGHGRINLLKCWQMLGPF